MLLTSLLVVLAQNPELTPELLQQAVRGSDVIVTGALTRIDEAKLAKSDGSPFKRATVVPTSVLKGHARKGKALTFLKVGGARHPAAAVTEVVRAHSRGCVV